MENQILNFAMKTERRYSMEKQYDKFGHEIFCTEPIQYTNPQNDDEHIAIGGKYIGTKLKDIPDSYLKWIYVNRKTVNGMDEYIEKRLGLTRGDKLPISFCSRYV